MSLNAPDEVQDSVHWLQRQVQTICLESAHYLHALSWNRLGGDSQGVAEDLWSVRSLAVSGGTPRTHPGCTHACLPQNDISSMGLHQKCHRQLLQNELISLSHKLQLLSELSLSGPCIPIPSASLAKFVLLDSDQGHEVHEHSIHAIHDRITSSVQGDLLHRCNRTHKSK